MADGLKIGWNQENLNQMIRQIEEMKNKVTENSVNISINKDSVLSQLDSMISGIKNMQEKASTPIDIQINTTKSQEELANIKGSFEDIANAYKNLGNASFSSINFDGNGMLKDFTIQLEQVNGLIDKVKYNAKDFVDGQNNMTPISFKVDNIKQINDIDKVIDKVENFKNKYNDAIRDLQGNGNVKESSIGEFQKQLDSLNTTNFKEKLMK
ncbi:hypothetical protein [Clostridium ljungdahlii]|uniref:hypothetical protein n=1 Tax=Clostridium ljungdahlii TaxID=1538 RepID=UPI003863D5E8